MNERKSVRGMSIIEILIYVAILSIMGVVLANYFIAAVGAQVEHGRRNDLSSAAERIGSALSRDLRESAQLIVPATGGTSTNLVLSTLAGNILYQRNGDALVRTSASGTDALVDEKVLVRSVAFFAFGYFEPRLGATTTLVRFRISLEHAGVSGALRTVEGASFVGKDSL